MSKIGFVGDKMRFSERYGYQSIREIIQKNSINTDLKNALWNTIIVCIFNKYSYHFGARSRPIIGSNLESFFQLLFHSFFGGVSKSMLKKSRLNFDKIEKCK